MCIATASLKPILPTQVQGMEKIRILLLRRCCHGAGGMAVIPKPCYTSALGFIGVDREGIWVTTPGVLYMVGAAADGAAVPGIHNIKYQWRMHWDSGMQR